LRIDDEYKFRGDAEMDSIYDGSAGTRVAFKRYLRKVERKRNLFLSWWDGDKAKECIRFGSDLGVAVEKSDIIEYYDSSLMSMQLRTGI
jgi:hypothetical protein